MAPASLLEPIRHPEALTLGRTIRLDTRAAEQLRFRAIRPKEAFTLLDRDQRYFRASLVTLETSHATALVYEAMPAPTESPARITLVCAVLGRQRMLAVIQKATELGVVRVIPVVSERSVQFDGLAHEKAHAWPAQALRAARQCRRASLPEIREAVSLEAALVDPAFLGADLRVHLDDREALGDASSFALGRATDAGGPKDIVFCVGPEGGFSEGERRRFEDADVTQLRLGGRVLRAETAALVGLGLLQHVYGDLR